MEKKKMLLMTGLSVSALAVSLIVTLNDFDDKPLRAFVGPNAQYALNIENQNSSISDGHLVYERNDGKQFIFSTNGERNGNELITLGNGEYLEMITPVWNIESVIAEEFKDEPGVPLFISFENPCGLIVSTLDCFKETQRDSVVGTFDVKIETHHYEYYGFVEDSLQTWVEGCCMLAGHLCYIYPDIELFKPTGCKQKVSFITHDEYCPCLERELYLNITNNNGVQVVPFYELLEQYGSVYSCTAVDEVYDSLANN